MSELDFLIADHITKIECDVIDGVRAYHGLPAYSSDLNAAWQIDKPGWRWSFYETPDRLEARLRGKDYRVLAVVNVSWNKAGSIAAAYCIARCRAALEAIGVDWEGEDE